MLPFFNQGKSNYYCETHKLWVPEIYLECYFVARRKPKKYKKLNCNSHGNKFVVFRFAHLSCTLLWLVTTQSTVWKFFRCSQLSEFDSNTLIEVNLHLITLYFHLLHLLLTVPSTDWKWEQNIQITFNIQTNIASRYVQVCRQLQNLLKLENSLNQGRAVLEEVERAPMIFVILHFFCNYCKKLDHFWDFSQVHKKSQICSCMYYPSVSNHPKLPRLEVPPIVLWLGKLILLFL